MIHYGIFYHNQQSLETMNVATSLKTSPAALLAVALLSVFSPSVQAEPALSNFQGATAHQLTHIRKVRTTAYTHTEADHIKYAKNTAAGTQLRAEASYTSAAADWSVFPLGTIFRIRGLDRIFVIDDYGSALVGTETIDLYHPDRQGMNTWGVQHVEIEILEHGCLEDSLKILSGRVRYAHCKQMHDAVAKRLHNS